MFAPYQCRTGSKWQWITVLIAAGVSTGPIFRAINKAQRIAKTGFSPKMIWRVVKGALQNVASTMLLHTI